MQSAKLTASCSACRIWAAVKWLPELDAFDELGEFEPPPQPASKAAATVVAARSW
jgi:hypothetical protein